jgi:CheY-like chemotaxis protein
VGLFRGTPSIRPLGVQEQEARKVVRILVAEDNRGVREWLAELLLGADHEVTTARDGLEAKRLANHLNAK